MLALYARYQADSAGFADRYIAMLTKGGADWPHEIVKPLGVDLTDPAFWANGLNILEGLVVEAEALATAIRRTMKECFPGRDQSRSILPEEV